MTYTFHLNRRATWHDGTDVTADDVRFSFDAALSEDLGYFYRSSIVALVNSYRVIDPDTFELIATEPIATFVHDVPGTIYVMPRHLWQEIAFEDWANDPGSTGRDAARVVGSGPFRFAEWAAGDHVTLTRNENYYGQKPSIDQFTIRFLTDEATALSALENGEIDIYDVESPASVHALRPLADIDLDVFDTFRFTWYAMNLDPTRTTLFQDREVRQALFYALDRDAIASNVYLGLAEPAIGTQPKLSVAYAPDRMNRDYRYDPEEAKRLLALGGWQDSNGNGVVDKDGQELAFELLYTENVEVYGRLVPLMREAWRAIGVEVTPLPVPFETLDESLFANHDFEMGLLGFSWDVTGNQAAMFDCDSYAGGFNAMKFCDPSYDLLSEQELREFDLTKRIDLLVRQTNVLNEEMPVGVLVFPKDAVASSSRLHNFYPNGYSLVWSLSRVWVDD
jgi:peptide/nickel transport system substrate-binding protein